MAPSHAEPSATHSAPGPADTFRRYGEALDRGDVAAMADLVADDFRMEGAGLDGVDKAGFMGAMAAQLAAFPDYSENPTDLREDGDWVHFVAHVSGTQRGALVLAGRAPVAATGRSIQLPPEPASVRVRNGRLLVYRVTAVPGGGLDGILRQIGAGSG